MQEGYVGFSTEVRMGPKPLSHAQVGFEPTYAIYRGSTIELLSDEMCGASLYTALYSFSTTTILAQLPNIIPSTGRNFLCRNFRRVMTPFVLLGSFVWVFQVSPHIFES